jgi:hypothetical protein
MKNTFKDKSRLNFQGHVLIKDPENGEVFLDKHNAINFQNMAVALAQLLAGKDFTHVIRHMRLGNGGTTVDSTGVIAYKSPNINGEAATLYNQTYSKNIQYIDPQNDPLNEYDPDNSISAERIVGETYTDIIVTSTLDYSEPEDQNDLDNTELMEGNYVFDEIGLESENGNMLTHIIFHPIEKSANRKIQIIYTLRIKAGN